MDFFNISQSDNDCCQSVWLQKKKLEIVNPFPGKHLVFYDLEIYPNYFLGVFIGGKNKPMFYTIDNIQKMVSDISNNKIILVGFNNSGFDDYVIKWIMKNISRYNLKEQSQKDLFENDIYKIGNGLITKDGWINNKPPQWYWDLWNYKLPIHRSIDIFNLPKREVGLKERATQRHAITIQDLPIKPCTVLTEKEKSLMGPYCVNDVRETIEEWNSNIDHVINRISIEKLYPYVDVISRHDAGVCEEVLTKVYCQKTGLTKKYVTSLRPKPGKKIKISDCIPKWIRFNSIQLTAVLDRWRILKGRFSTKADKTTLSQEFNFHGLQLSMGGGGLHSDDEPLILKENPDKIIMEIDVAGYYTGLIKAMQLKPAHLDHTFNTIQEELGLKRYEAKHNYKATNDTAFKVQDKGLKIITLSIFGKTGSEWSILFDELMQLQITLGGQLSILMLIEMLTFSNIKVISANTDGLIVHIDKNQLEMLRRTYKVWETQTGQDLEESIFKLYVRRDVNNYFVIKSDDDTKEKGLFKEKIKLKASIISETLREYFKNGVDVYEYIHTQTDLRKFIYYFKAKNEGGTKWELYHKQFGNKMINIQNISRWYISKGVENPDGSGFNLIDKIGDVIKCGQMIENQIEECKRLHPPEEWPKDWKKFINVSNGKNSIIINTLPNAFPVDLDFNYYINQVNDELKTIELNESVIIKPKSMELF